MDIKQKSQNSVRCKIILVGDSAVGKTSIIGRYLKKFNEKEKMTIGASFTNKQEMIDDKMITFNIWDTAGQEKFRSLAKVFYKNAAICVLVYDITRYDTFEELEHFWVDEIKNSVNSNVCKLIF